MQKGGFNLMLALAGALGVTAGTQVLAASEAELQEIRDKFVGHYELVSFIRFTEEGGEVDTGYEGRIMYDEFGNMSAIGMPRRLPELAASSGEERGGFAYYGSVSCDLENDIVIHHVEGSPTRGSWVGEDNVRYFEFVDGFLKLSMKDESGRTTGTLTWRKYDE